MYSFVIGLRSLLYRYRQYLSLFFVCLFGVGVSVTALYVNKGMMQSLNDKARVYYGGDFAILRAQGFSGAVIRYDSREVEKLVKSVVPSDAVVTTRLTSEVSKYSFFFEGSELHFKTLIGSDFDNEKELIGSLNFIAGGTDDMKGTNGILISDAVARKTHISVGDSLSFLYKNNEGYTDTADFVVKGIYQDSSVFGMFTGYTSIEYAREVFGDGINTSNRICIQSKSKIVPEVLQKKLEDNLSMHPLVSDKQSFFDAMYQYKDPTYALLTLDANLTDIKILEKAMTAIIVFIVSMLVLIIVAGIGSTYKVFVLRRLNEIGIYMAIGMKKRFIILTLLFESFILLFAGCLGGIVFSGILCLILHCMDFSFIPAFDIFLTRGLLCPAFDLTGTILVTLCVITVTLGVVLYSVYRSVRIMPCKALASLD